MARSWFGLFITTLAILLLMVAVGGCKKKTQVKSDSGQLNVGETAPATKTEDVTAPSVYAPNITGQQVSGQGTMASSNQASLAAGGKNKTTAAGSDALRTVYFDFDQFSLTPEAQTTLKSLAPVLKGSKNEIVLEGHCDERGTEDYNLALGEKRALSAKNYLKALGVNEEMKTVSFGASHPVDPDHTEEAWAKNRRVEIK